MIYFNCDYTEGAHPQILDLMQKTNFDQTAGYGEDAYCGQARALIRAACGREDADVHFLVGGTQANMTVIAAALRPHQGVLSAVTGHINAHETGAVEATGHKVLALPGGRAGKLSAAQIAEACRAHWADSSHEHLAQPKMAYLSLPTENGAVYSKAELAEISRACRENGLYLFLDGARLGYGLTAAGCDLTLPDLCELCDVFYIGGTKCGALFGEAVVILNEELKADFRYHIKQRGGMLAKGRMLGLQFLGLFTGGLYFDICRRANEQAARIAEACRRAGFPFYVESVTNQQFPILPDEVLERLSGRYQFSDWERMDETHRAVRICTSWATRDEHVDALCADMQAVVF